MREIIDNNGKTLKVNETEGAVLNYNRNYTVYKYYLDFFKNPLKIYDTNVSVTKKGNKADSLKTDSIFTCAGITWRNKNNCALMHVRTPESLEKMFPVIFFNSIENSGLFVPKEVYLIADEKNIECYQPVLNKFKEKYKIPFELKIMYDDFCNNFLGGGCTINEREIQFSGDISKWKSKIKKPEFLPLELSVISSHDFQEQMKLAENCPDYIPTDFRDIKLIPIENDNLLPELLSNCQSPDDYNNIILPGDN